MITKKDFADYIQGFFTKYLINELGVSTQTIRSYRDTFALFIRFMEEVQHIPPDRISLEGIDRNTIVDFLDWLQIARNCSNATRNIRCAAIRSFYRYLMYEDPTRLAKWKAVMSIRFKKEKHDTVNYLTVEGIRLLLDQIPTDTLSGRRNLTMLSLMYASGARVQEIINLTPKAIRTCKPYVIELFGKGAKKRIVPLNEDVMKLLLKYMEDYGLNRPEKSYMPLFCNTWGEHLTSAGITYILQKYAGQARLLNPELMPDRISPHVLRHSKAMHLLQAGVNLIYIRDLLGHVSVQTTEIYARVDSKAKREALEKAYVDVGISEKEANSWDKDPKLKAFLKSLA